MDTLELRQIFDEGISLEKLISFITKNLSGFILKTHYNYIGSCQSSIDVMQDHLEMAFICEKLSQYSKIMKYERDYDKHHPEILITLIPNYNEAALLAKELQYVSTLKAEKSEPNREELEDLMAEIQDFEDSIEQISFNFTDEIEDYYANYVNQGLYEIADEFILGDEEEKEEYILSCFDKNPEWKYGFWKNHIQNIPKESLYFSSFCWIIRNDIDVNSILSKHSGIEKVVFDDSVLFENLIINDFAAIDFSSLKNFDQAISFINSLDSSNNKNFTVCISQNFDVIKILYAGYYIVYFDFHRIREDVLKEMYEKTSLLREKLSVLLGFSKDISCDWNKLTDESFEELCYDIIYNNIKFDNQTIRKMGKSKSRDGGRDIVVYTKSQYGDSAKKYIVQCKLLKKSSSLTKSMMNNASNVIMEYEADGYIVMTNAVIDSGLYDMLDGFNRNHQMHTDTTINYSKFEMERYLARNVNIKQQYFI